MPPSLNTLLHCPQWAVVLCVFIHRKYLFVDAGSESLRQKKRVERWTEIFLQLGCSPHGSSFTFISKDSFQKDKGDVPPGFDPRGASSQKSLQAVGEELRAFALHQMMNGSVTYISREARRVRAVLVVVVDDPFRRDFFFRRFW